ncbi:MAG: aspartate/glutamate racemase family protein [Lautropia sp.]
MKIWYQSASAYRHEAVWDAYGQTLEQQCGAVIRADTELHVTGIPVMVRDIENWRALQYYQNIETLNNMRRAEREGFDAFVIGCTLDVGLAEGRSLMEIPVVGISETAYHMAMMLGRQFAIVTSSSAFGEVYGEQVVRYGVDRRYLPGPYRIDASEEEIASALGRPGPLLDKFLSTAQRAVDDGASVIIPAPAFLSTLAYRAGITDVKGATVLDTIALAVKSAEMMVDLGRAGVRPSRRIGVYAKPEGGWENPAFERLRPVFRMA